MSGNLSLSLYCKASRPSCQHSFALGQGLFKRICLTQGKEWTEQAEKEFVERMYRIYANNPD